MSQKTGIKHVSVVWARFNSRKVNKCVTTVNIHIKISYPCLKQNRLSVYRCRIYAIRSRSHNTNSLYSSYHIFCIQQSILLLKHVMEIYLLQYELESQHPSCLLARVYATPVTRKQLAGLLGETATTRFQTSEKQKHSQLSSFCLHFNLLFVFVQKQILNVYELDVSRSMLSLPLKRELINVSSTWSQQQEKSLFQVKEGDLLLSH